MYGSNGLRSSPPNAVVDGMFATAAALMWKKQNAPTDQRQTVWRMAIARMRAKIGAASRFDNDTQDVGGDERPASAAIPSKRPCSAARLRRGGQARRKRQKGKSASGA